MTSTSYSLTLDVTDVRLTITTVDITSDSEGMGKYKSCAFDKSGIPHISCYDAVKKETRYAYWINNVWSIQKGADTDGTFST